MRDLILIILISALTATANATCERSDLAGRWEFHSNSMVCRFLLDEEGFIEKGNCWEHIIESDGMVPRAYEYDLGKMKDGTTDNDYFTINGYCKVEGGFQWQNRLRSEPSQLPWAWVMIGRLNLDRSIVTGLAGFYVNELGRGGESHNFTMVKY